MHVMIATDGSLDAEKAAVMAASLAGDSGRVTVFTVVEVPRQLLEDLRHAASEAEAVDVDVAYRRTQAGDNAPGTWVGDDAFVDNYVNRISGTRTSDLVGHLESRGVDHHVVGVEGESASRSVLEAVKEHAPDVLCIGTHGLGRFEGLLGSLSTKVARLAPCSVLLVR